MDLKCDQNKYILLIESVCFKLLLSEMDVSILKELGHYRGNKDLRSIRRSSRSVSEVEYKRTSNRLSCPLLIIYLQKYLSLQTYSVINRLLNTMFSPSEWLLYNQCKDVLILPSEYVDIYFKIMLLSV